MTSQKLSVVMANYNHCHYIGDALHGIMRQSFKPHEVIVVDDASTDDSVSVITRIAKDNPSVRLFRNNENRGPIASINHGIQHASGEYLYLAGADDKVLPELFGKSMELLAQHP